MVTPSQVELYLELSERARNYVEKYFNLKKKLYFDFTHLVCRTALGELGSIFNSVQRLTLLTKQFLMKKY